MVHIKTKEGASLWIALLATAIVAVGMVIQHIEWWITLCTSVGVFVVVALAALFIIRKYVAYKLKPIYSIVLSRDVHTNEIFSELKDKRVENIGEELTAWADTNDREIARLKEAECFRKQYLGNVAHELKTPIFNIQGYISTLLDGGLEDELINRKYLERAEKSIDRLINIVNDLDTISKLESSMNKLNLEHSTWWRWPRRSPSRPRWRPTGRRSGFRSRGPTTCLRPSGCWPTNTTSGRCSST